MATRLSRAITFRVDSKIGAPVRNSLQGVLRKFTEDVQQKALRSAARAGALVFYNEMRLRAPINQDAVFHEKHPPGLLRDSIYHWHDDDRSTNGRQIYMVGPNKRKAPHWFFMEYGHYQYFHVYVGKDGRWYTDKLNPLPAPRFVPPQPYVRPTWDAKKDDAIRAMRRRLAARLRELIAGQE